MRALFVSEDGTNIIRLPDPYFGNDDTGLITFEDLTGASAALLLTGMSDNLNPRYQVVDTLGDRTILNTFGRSLDTRQVDGLCYEGLCLSDNNGVTGYEDLNNFFSEHNASVRDEPLVMTIGKAFSRFCYLLEMRISLADPHMRVWQFSLRLVVEPERAQDELRLFLVPPPDAEVLVTEGDESSDSTPISPGLLQSALNSIRSAQTYNGFVGRTGDPTTPAPVAVTTSRGNTAGLNPFIV